MPLISSFLRRLIGVNSQMEGKAGREEAALCGLLGGNLGPRSLRLAVKGMRTVFRLSIALQH